MDGIKRYTEANRLAWNEVMPHHQHANKDRWEKAFSNQRYTIIPKKEAGLLDSIELAGKRIAHLCCNNGVELMSLKNMGAGECVGFDICDEAIKEARLRAKKYAIPCKFVRKDVYDIAQEYYGHFDLIYISAGCLIWMPDLELFFKKAALLLNKTGRVFIHEIHPISQILPIDDQKDKNPLEFINSYFKDVPYEDTRSLDYIGKSQYDAKVKYWFLWTLSEIIMGLKNNGLVLEHFSEYADDISCSLKRQASSSISVPLSYIIIAKKYSQ